MDLKKLEEVLKAHKTNISASTVKFYLSTFKNIIKRTNLDFTYNKEFFKTHLNDLIKYVHTLENLQTKKNVLAVLIVFCKAYGGNTDDCKPYTNEILKITDVLDNQNNEHKKTEKQEANMISLNKIKDEIMPYLKSRVPANKHVQSYQDYINFMKYYLLLMYSTRSAPLRNDWAEMKLIKDHEGELSKDYNYIIYNSKNKTVSIILNQYKTAKTHGTININIDDKEIIQLTKRLSELLPKFSDDGYILVKHDKKGMSDNSITKFFNSIFKHWGYDISTTMLRHIVISDSPLYDKEQLKEQAEREDLANRMGHSVNTAFKQYVKE